MQVQLPVNSNQNCKIKYQKRGYTVEETNIRLDERVICTGYSAGGKDTCQGDSGGPLMLPVAGANGTFPFYQIGIISWANGCAQPDTPGINTKVQYFANWIKKKLAPSLF